jgi:beta-lactamase class A
MKKKISGIVISLIFLTLAGFGIKKFLDKQRFVLELEKRRKILLNFKDNLNNEIAKFGQRVGILIKDLKSDYKIGLNENMAFGAASLIKIPIMACVYCAEQANRIDMQQKITIKNQDKTAGSGILKNIAEGVSFEVEELLHLMIAYSDNTASNLLIDQLGFDYLNNCFKNLGLKNTSISRKILDIQARNQGKENYTTAQDIGHILEMLYKGQLINKDISEKALKYLKQQKIRDRIPALLPSYIPVAHKTGLENGLCHDAGIMFTKEGDFLICVLIQHKFKTAKPAKQFIAEISKKLFYAFNKDE